MKKRLPLVTLFVVVSLGLFSCGGAGENAAGGRDNLFARMQRRGYLLVATDLNYEPQSFLDTSGARKTGSKCPLDALTAPEMDGFDVDVAEEIGKRLGLETCFMTPTWEEVAKGRWNDKWDINVGSMTVKAPRAELFYFTTPYYAPAGVVGVAADSPFTSVEQLAGETICVATETTYYDWLNNSLDVNPEDIYVQPPAGVKIVEMAGDQECPQALAAGRANFVAYATSKTVVDSNVAAGMPVKQLGGPVFLEKNAVAFDKFSPLDQTGAIQAIDKIINEMHADGTLSALSLKWYGVDLTQGLAKP